MIKINLALRKQASYAAGATSVKAGPFVGLKASGELASLLSRILVPVAICVTAYFAFDSYIQGRVAEMRAETDVQQKEKTKIQGELAKISGFEAQKADLKRQEDALLNKINTVERLISGRDRALKELIGVAQALPKDVWLSSITATETRLLLNGNAEDMSLISDVMSKLQTSIHFTDVSLTRSSSDASGVRSTFEVTAGRR